MKNIKNIISWVICISLVISYINVTNAFELPDVVESSSSFVAEEISDGENIDSGAELLQEDTLLADVVLDDIASITSFK